MTTERQHRERGDTLVELLVAVVIMGIAVVAVAGGVATSIRMSDIHRKQAAAGAYVRDFAEAIETAIATVPTGYIPCAAPGAYDAAYPFAVSGFSRDSIAVDYWNGLAFVSTCTVATDLGVQRLSLRVASADTRVSETMVIIVRKPCRSTLDFPSELACS
jgi:prepilin-type N-terminal cleavage/methylation domain-containing protein